MITHDCPLGHPPTRSSAQGEVIIATRLCLPWAAALGCRSIGYGFHVDTPTMLQVATPNAMQGRLQGVYSVVVTGGTRLGDIRAEAVGSMVSPPASVMAGGVGCVAGLAILIAAVPAFLRYDARRVAPHEPVGPVALLSESD